MTSESAAKGNEPGGVGVRGFGNMVSGESMADEAGGSPSPLTSEDVVWTSSVSPVSPVIPGSGEPRCEIECDDVLGEPDVSSIGIVSVCIMS